MVQVRASTVHQGREEVCAAMLYAASFHCLVEERKDGEELKPRPKEKWTFVNKNVEARKHRTECRTAAIKCRCLRCGRSSKQMKIQVKCEGPKWLQEDSKHKLGRWCKSHLGLHDMVRRVARNGEALIWCRKCSGYARERLGPKLMIRYTTENGYERVWDNVETNLNPRRGEGPGQECERMDN